MAKRLEAHEIDDNGVSHVKCIITKSGRAIFREFTGRDYGYDGIIEVFDKAGNPTGKIAFVQIKSTSSEISPLANTPDEISCPGLSNSSLYYCRQEHIPFILAYISLKNNKRFYYAILNNRPDILDAIAKKADRISARIPVKNVIEEDLEPLLEEIDKYYI